MHNKILDNLVENKTIGWHGVCIISKCRQRMRHERTRRTMTNVDHVEIWWDEDSCQDDGDTSCWCVSLCDDDGSEIRCEHTHCTYSNAVTAAEREASWHGVQAFERSTDGQLTDLA